MFCCSRNGGIDAAYKKGILLEEERRSVIIQEEKQERRQNRGFIPWVWSRQFHETYQLGPILGEGSYAIVHEAVTIAPPHKQYAVKVVPRCRLRTQKDLKHFHDEIQILLDIGHHCPHIVQIHELFKLRDYFFVVMDKIEGGELFDRMCETECYSEKDARDVCVSVFEALAYCHSQKIAHRDVKPENLLCSSKTCHKNIKLADFGFAKRVYRENTLLTQCGTPQYLAPEIANAKPYDTRVDNWSLGVIVYCILGGENPFLRKTVKQTLQEIRQANYTFPPQYWDGISRDAKNLIRGLLTVDPNRRMTAAEALMHPWMTGRSGNYDDLLQKNTINLGKLKDYNEERHIRNYNAKVKSTNMYWLVSRR